MNNRNSDSDQIAQLYRAIQELEDQRELLGNVAVQAAIEGIEAQLAELEGSIEEVPQQRKQATILFTDIVGHTKLVQDLDPEDNMAIIDQALVRLAKVVEAHGGHVARFQGDGFKAVFGLPTAQESDPENAVRAGLGIIAAAQVYAGDLEREWGLEGFNVRVGIDTGLIVAGGATEAEDTIKGLVVNLAARLESAAPPGGVLISHHTFQNVRGLFDVDPQLPIMAKGFPEPVAVYLVRGAKSGVLLQGTRGVEGVETRMIGRDEEFRRLQEAYQSAVSQNQTTVVTIVGEAGVGKSRLLFEFERWLQAQSLSATYFMARASQQKQSNSIYLLREMLAERFAILASDPLETVRQKFVSHVSEYLAEDAEMKAHILGARLGYDFGNSSYLAPLKEDPNQLSNRAVSYLAQFFTAVSNKVPVIIVLEDIHWADGGSLDLIIELVQRLSRAPIFIICLSRPSLFEWRSKWRDQFGHHMLLHIAPLSALDIRALVGDILQHVDPPPHILLTFISERAEGNPFYAEELIKMLIDDGIIVTGGDKWQVRTDALVESKVPATLTGVLQARLDRLKPSTKEALQQASVIGRVFWDEAFSVLPNEAQRSLPQLQAKEFIFSRATSAFFKSVEYIFKHALMRDVTYETVLLRLRREYHGHIARWLEQNAQDRLDEFAGLIAEHYSQAAEGQQASIYWERAGDVAFRSGDFAAARDAYTKALRFDWGRDLLPLAQLECKLGATLPPIQQVLEAETVYRKALARLSDSSATDDILSTRLDILLALMDVLYWLHEPEKMAELNDQVELLLDKVGTEKQRADYHSRRGQELFLRNGYRITKEGLRLARISLVYAQNSGQPLLIARHEFHLGFYLLWLGFLKEAQATINQALVTARDAGDMWLHLQCLVYITIAGRLQGSVQAVEEHMPRLVYLSRQFGNKDYLAVRHANRAWLHFRDDQLELARIETEQALTLWEMSGYPFKWLAQWLVLGLAWKKKSMLESIAAAQAIVADSNMPLHPELVALLETAVADEAEGKTELAEARLKTVVDLAAQFGYL